MSRDDLEHVATTGLRPNAYGHVPVWEPGVACVSGRMARLAQKLGIEHYPCFHGVGKYGPVVSGIAVREEDRDRLLKAWEEGRVERERARNRAADRRRRAIREICDRLGVSPDSRTLRQYLRGEIDEAEARYRGRLARWRHDETDYDDLLARGFSREDARMLIAQSCTHPPRPRRRDDDGGDPGVVLGKTNTKETP